jgi:hypothetical protein
MEKLIFRSILCAYFEDLQIAIVKAEKETKEDCCLVIIIEYNNNITVVFNGAKKEVIKEPLRREYPSCKEYQLDRDSFIIAVANYEGFGIAHYPNYLNIFYFDCHNIGKIKTDDKEEIDIDIITTKLKLLFDITGAIDCTYQELKDKIKLLDL